MATDDYDVFISYRRQGGDAQALFLREKLLQHNLHVFLDVTDLKKGFFDEELLNRIAEAPNFVVILSPNALDRCKDDGDWLRQEIAQAVRTGRNIIPIIMWGFAFPSELSPDIKAVTRHQGVEYSHVYFDAMVAKILASIEADRAERERLAREKEELERRERDERERIATERRAREIAEAEAQRKAAEQGEAERETRKKAERDQRKREKAAAEEEEQRKAAAVQALQTKPKQEARPGSGSRLEAPRAPEASILSARQRLPKSSGRSHSRSRWLLGAVIAAVLVMTLVHFLRSGGSPFPNVQKTPLRPSSTGSEAQPTANDAVNNAAASPQATVTQPTVPQQSPIGPGARELQASQRPVSKASVAPTSRPRVTEGTLTDSRTGLMWTTSDNGSEISWDNADRYCKDLTLGGYSDWRLPTIEELKGIYDPENVSAKVRFGGEVLDLHTISGFHLSRYDVWSGRWQGLDAVGFFRFNDGEKFRVRREKIHAYDMTALCVRSSRQ